MSHTRHTCIAVTIALALAACGAQEEAAAPAPQPGPAVSTSSNPLEASGQLEFFVKIAGFQGESSQVRRMDNIPAIRFYANIVKPDTGATRCSTVRFTKAAGISDPAFLHAMSTGVTLPAVQMEFVRPAGDGGEFVWQRISMTGMRVSRVEQAVSPPDNLSPSAVLEEVTFEPNNTAMITVTSISQNADGSAGAAVVTTFSCSR